MENRQEESVSHGSVYSFLLVALLTFVFVEFCRWFIKLRKYRLVFDSAPGPSGKHWLYGNLHQLPSDPAAQIKVVRKWTEDFPQYYRFWTGPLRAYLILNHPDTIKVALSLPDPKPKGFGSPYRHGIPWLGEGLLIADGKRWSRARRLLTPAFHFNILKPYMKIYNDAADALLEKIGRFADEGQSFELFQVLSLCTLDIILRCAFSYETECQQLKTCHPYVKSVKDLTDIWTKRNRNPLLYPDFIFYLTKRGRTFLNQCKEVHSVAEKIITERKRLMNSGEAYTKRPYLDFLDLLLLARDENGKCMSDKEIRNEVDTFLFEGHDTTASALSWIVYSMANNPKCQKRLAAELGDILEDRSEVEWEDLHRMEYLIMCIKEVMRDHSPVPLIQRQSKSEIILDGITYPPGTFLTISINSLHHNPAVWDNPYEFDPERFSKTNSSKIDNFAFIPFSAGPRNCIGQHFALNEEKVLAARIFQKFEITLDPTHVVTKKVATVMRAENGIRVFAKRRC